MLSMGSSSGNVVKNLNEYMCDSAEDVKDLPVDVAQVPLLLLKYLC